MRYVPFAIIVLLGRLGGGGSGLLAGLLLLGLGGLGLGALVTRVVKGGKEVSSRLQFSNIKRTNRDNM